jgi:hypothetical protein
MRKFIMSATLLAIVLVPAVASAKLPFFGLDVDPIRPAVWEPITLTMSCYEDMAHTRPWGSCLGTGGRMAWVHPLDDDASVGVVAFGLVVMSRRRRVVPETVTP